jgi:anti-anti-sigma factor
VAKDFVQLSVIDSVNVLGLTLPGSLDSEEFDVLNESMLKSVSGKASDRWVLDLSGVNYMGSSVLGLMINVRQQIKSGGGQLALCGLSTPLMRIFHTCCLERLFIIMRSRQDALRALKG